MPFEVYGDGTVVLHGTKAVLDVGDGLAALQERGEDPIED